MGQMTITIPDRVQAALGTLGEREFGYDATAMLKHILTVATGDAGVHFKLELEPLPKGELPLFDAAKVSVGGGNEK